MSGISLAGFAAWYAVFLFSTTLHEAAHAWAARRGGDNTAYLAGSVSLNPVPHIQRERFGMIFVPIITYFLNGGSWMFGWASAPYNPYWAARRPQRALVMSLAGPLSHLLPITASCLLIVLGMRLGLFDGTTILAKEIMFLLNVTLELNLVLLVFNLLPFPPLDGSEVWYMFIKSETDRVRWRGIFYQYSFAGLLLAWYFFPRIFLPIRSVVWSLLIVALQ